MILNISTLSANWSSFSFNEPHTHFPILAELDQSGEARITTPLTMDLSARMTGGQVEVKGSITLTIEQPCGRCLEPFSSLLTTDLDLHFVNAADQAEKTVEGDEIELTEEALTRETFNGDHIDLTLYLQDEVIMAMPQKPACSETCKGLCRECGKDLNKGPCECDVFTGHPAFAKLKVLQGGK